MGNNLPINADIKQIVGIETTWEQEPSIIGKGIITLTRDTDIWKQGDGSKTYIELEELFKSTQYDELDPDVQLGFLDQESLPPISTNQLVVYSDDNKLHLGLQANQLEILQSNINDKSIFSKIYINGPNKIKFNKEYEFKIEFLYNLVLDFKVDFKNQITSEWIIPDNDKIFSNNDKLIFTLLGSETNYNVGDTLTIYGRIKDEFLNITSQWVKKDIVIINNTETLNDNYINSSTIEMIDDNIIILNDWYWNENIHYSKNKYVLTIRYTNKNNRISNVSIKCSDISVKINKISNHNNNIQKFLIEYPEYDSDTEISYDVCGFDVYGNNFKFTINQTVHP